MSVSLETVANSDLINWTIFQELLAMDEDEEGFALSLVETFVDQARGILGEIGELLHSPQSEESLARLSSLGHYLKGSAAALGLAKVQNECERLQNYGKETNFDGLVANPDTLDGWYASCDEAYENALRDYGESKQLLSGYFNHAL